MDNQALFNCPLSLLLFTQTLFVLKPSFVFLALVAQGQCIGATAQVCGGSLRLRFLAGCAQRF
jgi:hypothetical protein